ncbi:Sds3-like protein [Scheffersomyces coipomensis]|uniref:Sds3-like protein n=1 Tax=Scheffersomyces coipomensis TaxID=1788519 RepID=UPI00315E02BF
MEEQRRAGVISESVSKRDKKRQLIGTRLTRLDSMFKNDRDNFYRNSLHELQGKLSTLQQGVNEEFLNKKNQFEEIRDYELTKLRLWEEYQVKRIETEYKEDLFKAKENHDKMITLIKEKLYDKLQNQIKQLKEDKLLLNLVNGNSWSQAPTNDKSSSTSSNTAALNAVASSLNLTDRRSLRKRELSSRFTTGEADDLSDGGLSTTNASSIANNTNNNGYTSATGKRRRLYSTRYSSNDEMSSGITSGVNNVNGNHNDHTNGSTSNNNQNGSSNNFLKPNSNNNNHQHGANGTSGISSGNDSNLSDKDYDALNSLIMENDDGGASLVLLDKSNSNKPNTRGSHKQFTGLQGLKVEELNEDLNLLRNAIIKKD